jgi:hypothetical protein
MSTPMNTSKAIDKISAPVYQANKSIIFLLATYKGGAFEMQIDVPGAEQEMNAKCHYPTGYLLPANASLQSKRHIDLLCDIVYTPTVINQRM